MLERLESRERTIRRHTTPVREKERQSELFVLKRGTMMSYVLLDDGRRQILRFLYRGDLFGLSSIAYPTSPDTVCALTEAVICPIDRTQLGILLSEHPRLAALILAVNQVERVALTDRLAAMGRSSAKARVAGVLLEISSQQRRLERLTGATFTLGLTQEEVGDATGLTAVHVNRKLRELEDESLIAREGGRVTLLDEDALARSANFVDRFAKLDLGWLPPAR